MQFGGDGFSRRESGLVDRFNKLLTCKFKQSCRLFILHKCFSSLTKIVCLSFVFFCFFKWDKVELPAALLNAHLNRQCATQRQLKEVLFIEAADLFDEKELWEESISILKELATEYERSHEFEKLPPLLVI